MRVKLQAGAEIDSMSPAEFREEMEAILKRLGPLLEPKTILQYNCPKIVVPASGAVAETILYEAPTGYRTTLHRIAVTADGYTPGAPLTTAGAWLALWRDGVSPYNLLYPFPTTGTTVLPTVITEGSNAAVALRNGQRLVVSGALGAVTANIGLYFALQLIMEQEGQPS